jgi:Fe-S-cluster containining protein
LKVDAQAHEVLYAADYIRLRLSTEVEKIIFRSRAHLNRIKPMSLEEQLSTNNQCPLLVDGRCSIYDVRPISCRKHHATNVRLCEDSFNNGDPNLPGSENEELKMFGSVLWMGVKMGFRDAGYDSETYDFGSAIGEALANPVAARRWRDKKRAFSIEVRAKDSEMASSLDNMIDSAD